MKIELKQATAVSATGASAVLNTLKDEIGLFLETKGVPGSVYITISDSPSPGAIEGRPNLSEKNGGIFYSFSGKGMLRDEPVRLGGNVFLDKLKWALPQSCVKEFSAAKKAKAAEWEAKKQAK